MITLELSAADARWLRDHLAKIGGQTPTRLGKRLVGLLAASEPAARRVARALSNVPTLLETTAEDEDRDRRRLGLPRKPRPPWGRLGGCTVCGGSHWSGDCGGSYG